MNIDLQIFTKLQKFIEVASVSQLGSCFPDEDIILTTMPAFDFG